PVLSLKYLRTGPHLMASFVADCCGTKANVKVTGCCLVVSAKTIWQDKSIGNNITRKGSLLDKKLRLMKCMKNLRNSLYYKYSVNEL
ncbi:MAG: hypothetical protein KAR01_07985, partial [Desulfocapsa sp.]|nr:hypothetical protein [Desulfocapsa sp.]